MTEKGSAARFQDFAVMRLKGDSDVTYRAYDLLTNERKGMPTPHYMRYAGFHIPKGGMHEVLAMLQARFKGWGYGVRELGWIEVLLHEFWVYDRIKVGNKKRWPYRDPDEARKLMDEHERLKAKENA